MNNDKTRIRFKLERDEDGYPPHDVEMLWAVEHDGSYVVDNIPFYVQGINLYDTVDAVDTDGLLTFTGVRARSGHSTIRLAGFDEEDELSLIAALNGFGCGTEASKRLGLIAVDVPPGADIPGLRLFLSNGFESGFFDYEEACVTW
ncbi:MAG: DUF4265 domain-containing protein [Bacteroidetes bacterium]|nr:DUF4265 domain-containing protein [Bacteroidota bacterium]